MSLPDPLAASARRVLIVDNDVRWRVDLADLVRGWGYEPIEAGPDLDAPTLEAIDVSQSLWDDALHKAQSHACTVALVDLRLQSDEDIYDTSGLRLAQELVAQNPWLRCVIMSGFDAPLRHMPAVWPHFNKGSGPQELRRVLAEAFAERRSVSTGT